MRKITNISYTIIFIIIFNINLFAGIDSLAEKFYRDGLEYFGVGNFKDAAENFENSVNQDEDLFYILSDKGIFEELLSSEVNEVNSFIISICEKIIEKDKNESFALFYLGWAKTNLGLYVEARSILEKALKIMKDEGINTDDIEKVIAMTGF